MPANAEGAGPPDRRLQSLNLTQQRWWAAVCADGQHRVTPMFRFSGPALTLIAMTISVCPQSGPAG